MTTLTQASRQWARRPADERFTSLLDLQAFKRRQADHSRAAVASTRDIELLPDAADPSHRGLLVSSPTGAAAPTHWSFGQLCSLASPGNSPAAYFRESSLPVPVIADCLNFNLRFTRQAQEIGTLAQRQDDSSIVLRAATGPRYGRIWDAHVVDALVERFGDGISGYWRVPGEFGRRVDVGPGQHHALRQRSRHVRVSRRRRAPDRASGRRNGEPGSLARGFFVWNSEVSYLTLGIAFFLFDYVCCNRIIWGADQYTEIRIRHTAGAPDRWLEEVIPVLTEYAEGSAKPVMQTIEDARSKRIAF